MVWDPPAPVDKESVTPLRFVNANRARVPEVPASLTVIDEFVTVGTVYERLIAPPLFDQLAPFAFPNERVWKVEEALDPLHAWLDCVPDTRKVPLDQPTEISPAPSILIDRASIVEDDD